MLKRIRNRSRDAKSEWIGLRKPKTKKEIFEIEQKRGERVHHQRGMLNIIGPKLMYKIKRCLLGIIKKVMKMEEQKIRQKIYTRNNANTECLKGVVDRVELNIEGAYRKW